MIATRTKAALAAARARGVVLRGPKLAEPPLRTPARASATIALRFSLTSKATTRGGRLSSMQLQD
jgi:hypothetical protein